jgi:hypothetical protein
MEAPIWHLQSGIDVLDYISSNLSKSNSRNLRLKKERGLGLKGEMSNE